MGSMGSTTWWCTAALQLHVFRHGAHGARHGPRCQDWSRDWFEPARVCTAFLLVVAVIEKYTRNARFCLICNYVSKIIPALQSRCTRFRFAPLDPTFVRERVQYVVDTEK